jgi:hypothetical protein
LLFVKFSMMVFVDFDAHCYMFKIQVMKVWPYSIITTHVELDF